MTQNKPRVTLMIIRNPTSIEIYLKKHENGTTYIHELKGQWIEMGTQLIPPLELTDLAGFNVEGS